MTTTLYQGIQQRFAIDVSGYELPNAVWRLAIVSPATNLRYVADIDTDNSTDTHKQFVFPDGLKQDTDSDSKTFGALILDTAHKNGTAFMSVGVYHLEIYTADRTQMATFPNAVRVVSSNLMARNTADGEPRPTNEE